MKSTDMERKDRELRRARKKEEVLARKQQRDSRTTGDYINELHALFFFDTQKIYNIEMSEEIMELLEEMKLELPEKQWDNVLRKAIKKSGVVEKEEALASLKEMGDLN